MSDTNTCRLRVYVHVNSTPAKIEIEFPDAALAVRYRQSINGSKKLLPSKPSTVRMEMPREAVELEMSRSLGSIVLHFNNVSNAKKWADDISWPVAGQAKQVYIKQSWNDREFAELKKALDEKWRSPGQGKIDVQTAQRHPTQQDSTKRDRAGLPPRRPMMSVEAPERTQRLLSSRVVADGVKVQVMAQMKAADKLRATSFRKLVGMKSNPDS